MKARMTLKDPDNIEVTLSITASVSEWNAIGRELEKASFGTPADRFKNAVRNAIYAVTKQVEPEYDVDHNGAKAA